MHRLGRVRRRFGFDRNALRRPVDRRQRAVGAAAFALFAGLAPPASAALAAHAYGTGVAAERQQAANHRIDARVTGTRPEDGVGVRHAYAELAWTSPDGRPHSAVVPADKSVRPGMRHRIWVDATGALARAPSTHTDTVAITAVSALTGAAVVGVPLLTAYLVTRHRCDRRRDALWDESWSALTRS